MAKKKKYSRPDPIFPGSGPFLGSLPLLYLFEGLLSPPTLRSKATENMPRAAAKKSAPKKKAPAKKSDPPKKVTAAKKTIKKVTKKKVAAKASPAKPALARNTTLAEKVKGSAGKLRAKSRTAK